MNSIFKKLNISKPLTLILCLGLLLRIFYLIFFSSFFAKSYLGTSTIFYSGADFGSSLLAYKNLLQYGTFTVNLNNELGCFFRMPGYSFFIGIFYSILGESYYLQAICGFQIILDVIVIYLFFKIGSQIMSPILGYILAFIYSTYPIAILWSPVLMSDSLGVFFSIYIVYFYLQDNTNAKWLKLGLVVGIGILVRPQVILIIPVILLIEIWMFRKQFKKGVTYMFIFGLAILFTYGLYPARNLLLHNKLVLFQDLRGSGTVWNDATINYMQYVFSVQSNWEPLFTNVINKQPITIDKAAFHTKADSIKLIQSIEMAQNCSYSFSCWNGFWRPRLSFAEPNCDSILAINFKQLRDNQISQNPYHFWVVLPIENLTKCFFKSKITKPNTSPILKFVPLVFYYRTLLLLIGLLSSIWILFVLKKYRQITLLALMCFLSWYLLICFGTMPQLRNIEMRYLLPVDCFMLIPTGIFFAHFLKKQFPNSRFIN